MNNVDGPARSLRRLLAAALALGWRRAPRPLLSVVGLQVVASGAAVVAVLAAERLVGQLVGSGGYRWRDLVPAATCLAVASAAMGAVRSVQGSTCLLLGEQVSRRTTAEVLEVAAAHPLIEYDRPAFFDRLQRLQREANLRPVQLASGLAAIVGGGLGAAGLAAASVALHPALAAGSLLACVPLWWAHTRNSRDSYQLIRGMTPLERQRGYVANLLARRDLAPEIRCFGLAPELLHRYGTLCDQRYQELARLLRRRNRTALGAQLVSALVVGATFAALGIAAARGRLDAAAAVAGAAAVTQLRARLGDAVHGVSQLYEAALFVDDLESFLAARPPAAAEAPGQPWPLRTVQARDLWFTYPGADRPALRGVDLDLRAGEVVALVGENGSGKSTLAACLAGLYQPERGAVLWDGIPLASLPAARVRATVTAVFQTFGRYAFSVHDNIAFGDPTRLQDEHTVRRVAEQAGVHPIAARLPERYATRLSKEFEGGAELSGGQWQRVALARALFRDTPLVVLDEPSASLDPRAEHELFAALRTLFEDRTVLLVTHRLSSVRLADRVYVLHDGAVAEQGHHDELMAAGGRYAELYSLQASSFASAIARRPA